MNDMLQSALDFRAQGFAVHWLHPRSKKPVLNDWTNRPAMTAEELVQSYRPGYNVGFRPGLPSTVEGGRAIVVLDVDVRGGEAYAEEAYAAANALIDNAGFDVVTGSVVGRHKYLLCPLDELPAKAATTLKKSSEVIDGKPAYVIELLSTGKQCVLPPSIHPDSGRPYAWCKP